MQGTWPWTKEKKITYDCRQIFYHHHLYVHTNNIALHTLEKKCLEVERMWLRLIFFTFQFLHHSMHSALDSGNWSNFEKLQTKVKNQWFLFKNLSIWLVFLKELKSGQVYFKLTQLIDGTFPRHFLKSSSAEQGQFVVNLTWL